MSEETVKVVSNKRPATDCERDKTEVPVKVANVSPSIPISFAVSLKGERDDLQDAHVCIDDFKASFSGVLAKSEDLTSSSYYCLCDGHSGSRAALAVTKDLHQKILEQLRRSSQKPSLSVVESDLKRAIIDSYKQIDEEFLKKSAECKPPWKDGTTVTNVILLNKFLYVANVGDTRAVLYRQKKAETETKDGVSSVEHLQPIPLTRDHTAGVFEERQRIQKAGGTVKDGRVLGILEVSRSIGDGPYKGHGVTCVPEVKRLQLTPNDHFLVLACDGLWKVTEPSEVATILDEICKENEKEITKLAAQKLAAAALRKLSGDNVTVITVDLRPLTSSF